jgi:hypothetical protein
VGIEYATLFDKALEAYGKLLSCQFLFHSSSSSCQPFYSMGHWMGSQTEIEKGNYNSVLVMWNACECQDIVDFLMQCTSMSEMLPST